MADKLIKTKENDTCENVVAGIVGAFLFSLVGGILWFLIYQLGFIAGISGVIGAVCAIKGYTLFAKKESIKGIIISVIIALLVIVIAWYFCLAYDVYDQHKHWYEEGEIDYMFTYFESVQISHYYLSEPEIGPYYFGDLAIGLIFCIIGGASYVFTKIKNTKNKTTAPVDVPLATDSDEKGNEDIAETESTNDKKDTQNEENVFH